MTGARAAFTGHGLSPSERRVMERFDAGMNRAEIAVATGMALSTVSAIVARYGPGDDRGFRERAIRAATRQLGDAVAAYQARRAGAA